ncbi:GIY-YIG nuclease family protein [Microdochium nivale]|nr:GIY-YIG nuclease family protein [Microdochium nivale]
MAFANAQAFSPPAGRVDPDVYDMTAFHDIDPSPGRQCIFITQRGKRCFWSCLEEDDDRVRELYDTITADPELPRLEKLQELAKCNCCGRGKHRERIEDIGPQALLLPLARRWREEIREERARNVQREPRPPPPPPPPPLSRFRAYVDQPGQNTASKMRTPLSTSDDSSNRDLESGRLYIYSRDEDPGFVKIGWTKHSTVQRRLDGLASDCGYTPKLLYASPREVPFAQRAETLVHYELAHERRVERVCRQCRSSHQEWFEVDISRAVAVVKAWEVLMMLPDNKGLYDAGSGRLTDSWALILSSLVGSGLTVTAKALADHYYGNVALPHPKPPMPRPVAAASPPPAAQTQTTPPLFTFTSNSPTGIVADVSRSIPIRPARYTFLSGFNDIGRAPASPVISRADVRAVSSLPPSSPVVNAGVSSPPPMLSPSKSASPPGTPHAQQPTTPARHPHDRPGWATTSTGAADTADHRKSSPFIYKPFTPSHAFSPTPSTFKPSTPTFKPSASSGGSSPPPFIFKPFTASKPSSPPESSFKPFTSSHSFSPAPFTFTPFAASERGLQPEFVFKPFSTSQPASPPTAAPVAQGLFGSKQASTGTSASTSTIFNPQTFALSSDAQGKAEDTRWFTALTTSPAGATQKAGSEQITQQQGASLVNSPALFTFARPQAADEKTTDRTNGKTDNKNDKRTDREDDEETSDEGEPVVYSGVDAAELGLMSDLEALAL